MQAMAQDKASVKPVDEGSWHKLVAKWQVPPLPTRKCVLQQRRGISAGFGRLAPVMCGKPLLNNVLAVGHVQLQQ